MQLIKALNKTAVYCGRHSVSYADLLERISGFFRILKGFDAAKVAIFSENRIEWISAFFASWYHGAPIIPIDHLSSREELSFILNDCRPDVIFCSASSLPTVEEAMSDSPFQVRILVFEKLGELTPCTTFPFDFEPAPEETALIVYTSGTTGSPKGVVLSFENIWTNILGVSARIPIFQEAERVMVMLPLHHTFPLIGSVVAPLAVGATIAMTPSLSSEDILATLNDHRITIIIGVPRFYNLIRKGIRDKIDKSLAARIMMGLSAAIGSQKMSRILFRTIHRKFGGCLKYLVCGGAAIGIDAARDYKTWGFEMLEGYGMTEAAPMITFTRPGRRKLGSAGEALPGTELSIRDGEILARGSHIMRGYYHLPDESAQIIDAEGWLHTGDLGYLDRDGFLFITGRKKEIIVLSNGKNINPEEIEKSMTHLCPAISEIGVFTKNDQLHCVIFPDFQKLRLEEVHHVDSYFREAMEKYNRKASSFKKLMKMTIIKSELPKTRLGKIQRFLLEKLAGDETRRRTPVKEPEIPEYRIIKNYLAKTCDCEVHPDDHLEIDLGIDSLDKVNLISTLQNSFGITAGESLFSQCQTVSELAAYCHEKKSRIRSEKIDWHTILKENTDIDLPRSWFSHRLFKYLLQIVFRLYFRLRGKGLENLPETPCIITPNHQSFIDGFYITSLLKSAQLKKTFFFAKEKHVRRKWQKFLAVRHNVIIMDLNRDLKHSLQRMASALRKGKNIVIFPEGTRSKDGKIGHFKKFFAILSKELNVPIVPVVIQGAYDALPAGRHLPKFRQRIDISFTEPIFPDNHTVDSLISTVHDLFKGLEQPA